MSPTPLPTSRTVETLASETPAATQRSTKRFTWRCKQGVLNDVLTTLVCNKLPYELFHVYCLLGT